MTRRRSEPRRIVWLALLVALVAPPDALAVGVSATVNRREISADETIVLTVAIDGSRNPGEPTLPPLPDFDVSPVGSSTSMQFVNGRMSVTVARQYALAPRRTGAFTIGPVVVEIDGQQHQSEPFTLRVTAAASGAPPGPPGESQEKAAGAFVTATVSNAHPYVAEQVVYVFRFYRNVQYGNAQLQLPPFDGFAFEDLGQQKDFETTHEGVRYLVTEIRRALFPQDAGELQIPPAQLAVELVLRDTRRGVDPFFDQFFGRGRVVRKVLRSQPLIVSVRPLPPAPNGFSGLVGQFRIDGKLTKETLHVGESTTLTLTVQGVGNVKSIGEPVLPGLDAFKVYEDKPASSLSTAGAALSGGRTFTKALVPQRAGEVSLPGASVAFFDPARGEYVVARSGPWRLNVLPATGKEELNVMEGFLPGMGKQAVKVLSQDLLPLRVGPRALRRDALGPWDWFCGAVGLLVAPLLFCGAVAALWQRERLAQDVGLRRRRTALNAAQRRLKELHAARRAGREREAAELASRALREYLGDMLNVGGGALTAAEAGAALRQAGGEPDRVKEVEELLERLEAALYGATRGPGADLAAVEQQLHRLLPQLQRELRKAPRK